MSHHYLRLAASVLLERAQFYDELVIQVFELAAGSTFVLQLKRLFDADFQGLSRFVELRHVFGPEVEFRAR